MRAGHVVYLIGSLIALVALSMGAWDIWRSLSSGTPVAKHVVRENLGAFRSFDIDLDPGMNPMKFIVSAKIDTFKHSKTDWYRATLSLGGKTAVSQAITFHEPTNAYNEAGFQSMEFKVETRGRYRLAVDVGSTSSVSGGVLRMEVQTLRNASPLQWQRLLWYFGVFAGAWILAVVLGEKPAFLQKMEDDGHGRA